VFNLGIPRQRATRAHAQPIGRFDLGNAVILDALFDDYAGGFLSQNFSGPVVSIGCFPRHD
jgi:hypothetical protein